MGIALYEHNLRAYEAAAAMLEETGKAAVIHSTGTGKSFIGFKLCEDHPDRRVCWLSPSEYIFRTQLENLAAAGGEKPENVSFFTYAKLILMGQEELASIEPDFIVLDEFHRCGAEMWGKGVQALLKQYPEAPVLGLSATNIRYLDGQRDMADELFDGNVASEMTLGEAVVRGILTPPAYVLTAYSLQSDWKKYRRRVRGAKNPAARDAGEKVLEALRRALEQAEGLDSIFEKYLTNKTGKYLVFCASREHMEKMAEHVPEWFGKIDRDPHVYYAYSEDPETSRSFARFKEDSSGHLKLLFCIDMLNEGIHVDDVSGVILLRPTVSPIIFKQQIGRALSAGKSGTPVIIDVVNNIENLYSIHALQEEMSAAAVFYRSLGQSGAVVNESFQVVDELRDCKRLFQELEDVLSASWDLMYRYARKYYEKQGNLEVPRRYRTPEGYSLGQWLDTQRRVRAGKVNGLLTPERIEKLDALGFRWEEKSEATWKNYYEALQVYKDKHGDLDIKANYVTEDGLPLGRFVSNLRAARSGGQRNAYLTQERVKALDEMGFIWSRLDYQWECSYKACADYYMAHGELNIPAGYVSPEGLRIGQWVRYQRQTRRGTGQGAELTQQQISRLDAIGMEWEDAFSRKWEYGYSRAEAYYREHGNLKVPTMYRDAVGFPLGKWLKKHTEVNSASGRTSIKVTPERKAKLDAIGMNWNPAEDPWEMRYALAKAYYEEHGNLNVPGQYVVSGVWLGKWLNEQKQILRGNRKGKRLTEEQTRRLRAISFDSLCAPAQPGVRRRNRAGASGRPVQRPEGRRETGL